MGSTSNQSNSPKDSTDKTAEYLAILLERQKYIQEHGYGTPIQPIIGEGVNYESTSNVNVTDVTSNVMSNTTIENSPSAESVSMLPSRGQTIDISGMTEEETISNQALEDRIRELELQPEHYIRIDMANKSKARDKQIVNSNETVHGTQEIGTVIREALSIQQKRASVYNDFERGFRKVLENTGIEQQAKYIDLGQSITSEMQQLSERIRELIEKCSENEKLEDDNIATWKAVKTNLLTIQRHEKEKLSITANDQMLRLKLHMQTRLHEAAPSDEIADIKSSLQEEIQSNRRLHAGVIQSINDIMDELRIESAEHIAG